MISVYLPIIQHPSDISAQSNVTCNVRGAFATLCKTNGGPLKILRLISVLENIEVNFFLSCATNLILVSYLPLYANAEEKPRMQMPMPLLHRLHVVNKQSFCVNYFPLSISLHNTPPIRFHTLIEDAQIKALLPPNGDSFLVDPPVPVRTIPTPTLPPLPC